MFHEPFKGSLSLHDINGRILLARDIKDVLGSYDIDVSFLQKGVYLLNVSGTNLSDTKKVLINH
jgi:hypothetical protein